mmetsp:Transcript_11175/g.11246  ORF Transcript_11175/g.11246 Transcript_11175/m.11246 type:complete len:95 (-) Transcript_11175:1590-1874(-)
MENYQSNKRETSLERKDKSSYLGVIKEQKNRESIGYMSSRSPVREKDYSSRGQSFERSHYQETTECFLNKFREDLSTPGQEDAYEYGQVKSSQK